MMTRVLLSGVLILGLAGGLTGCSSCSDKATVADCAADPTQCEEAPPPNGDPNADPDPDPDADVNTDPDADKPDANSESDTTSNGSDSDDLDDGENAPPVVCLGPSAATPELDPTGACGALSDPTLEQGFLVDNQAPAGGDGSFAHPFASIAEAVVVLKEGKVTGSGQTKLYLVRRDAPYIWDSAGETVKFPLELYGGFVQVGPDEYARQLDTPTLVEFPTGLFMGYPPLRFDSIALTTQQIKTFNTPITIIRSQIHSYPSNVESQLMHSIISYFRKGSLTMTDSQLIHHGSSAENIVALEVQNQNHAQITIERSHISAGDAIGASYGVRLYRELTLNAAIPFDVSITDSTISAGNGAASLALLCGEKGDTLKNVKLGKTYGIGRVRIERSFLQAGRATSLRSLGLGLFNTAQPAVVRNSIVIGGSLDPANPPKLATAVELRNSDVSLINNTLRDAMYVLVVQLPVDEQIALRNNIIAPWEGEWGIYADPNPKFQYADLSNNLFVNSDSPLAYDFFYDLKADKVISCKQLDCSAQANQINTSGAFVTGGNNLIATAPFVEDGLHLAEGSPAINTGAPLTLIDGEAEEDLLLDNDRTPRDAQPDIGAFEWAPPLP